MPPLTDRELAMLRGFAEGKTYAQLGEELRLTSNVVKTVAASLYRKLGVHYMAHAVAQGFRAGILENERAAAERDWLLGRVPAEVRQKFFALRGEGKFRSTTTVENDGSRDGQSDGHSES
jgi:DNA-binding CsgD family transcriptional regulator